MHHTGLIDNIFFTAVAQVQLALPIESRQIIGTGDETEDLVERVTMGWFETFERLADMSKPDLEVVLLIIEPIKHHGLFGWINILVVDIPGEKVVIFFGGSHFSNILLIFKLKKGRCLIFCAYSG